MIYFPPPPLIGSQFSKAPPLNSIAPPPPATSVLHENHVIPQISPPSPPLYGRQTLTGHQRGNEFVIRIYQALPS